MFFTTKRHCRAPQARRRFEARSAGTQTKVSGSNVRRCVCRGCEVQATLEIGAETNLPAMPLWQLARKLPNRLTAWVPASWEKSATGDSRPDFGMANQRRATGLSPDASDEFEVQPQPDCFRRPENLSAKSSRNSGDWPKEFRVLVQKAGVDHKASHPSVPPAGTSPRPILVGACQIPWEFYASSAV